ncbi:zona pellucida sperm-binding protein 4-like isoform X2 [Corythoichthys intestinalis]|uniref:zona pellucida sperm-binding protein 4-like isoform X2 n=1 Tax=Corythoichthys intestinalis TaxID=161448 RepID=UPI0025A5929F|nr:zona pellucida sperm-binding protein 4-like isoform X2 [Corythoichthys intestinalis]
MRHSPAMKPIGVLALSLLACVATAQIAKQWTQRPSTPVNTKHCEVAPHHKIRCGPATISISECEKIGCCFDGNVCYYGRHVTLQCTQDGQMIVVISREATIPRVDLESISFITNEPGCRPVDTTSAFAIYQFPVTACGTVVTEEPGLLIYENAMSAFYEVSVGSYGAITRDSRFELAVQCRYVGTSVLALIMEVDPIPEPPPVAAPGPLNVQLRLGNGKRMAKGQMDEEVVFNYFYVDSDYPVTKELREPVYVEVRILGRTDPNLVLNLRRCWATVARTGTTATGPPWCVWTILRACSTPAIIGVFSSRCSPLCPPYQLILAREELQSNRNSWQLLQCKRFLSTAKPQCVLLMRETTASLSASEGRGTSLASNKQTANQTALWSAVWKFDLLTPTNNVQSLTWDLQEIKVVGLHVYLQKNH